MARSIHYEIFSRQGSKGGWKMVDVRTERESALALAQSLMKEKRATGVKVVKETYNDETGDYLTLKIFEDGHNQMKTVPAQEDVPHALPCFKPDDLYSYHARATITRLLSEFLARNMITVTELGHRADMLEKLEATGTLLQHAIQKVAVAQAASTTTPVTQIVKSLNELASKACNRVYRDERNKYFRAARLTEFGALANELAGKNDAAYQLNGAIAKYLKDIKAWDEKVLRLIALMHEAPAEGPGRTLLLTSVDTIISEILAGSAALHSLIGPKEDLGRALMSLVQLFLGKNSGDAQEPAGLASLADRFAADALPESRSAIANRILVEFKSFRRLCPSSLEDEFKMLRQIANQLALGVGKFLSHDTLVTAFTLRSSRLVTNETLAKYLADAATPEEKVERMLFVEENIIGAANKRQLAIFLLPIITANGFETHFVESKTPIISRLQKLAGLQSRVRRSGFQDNHRHEMVDLFDALACKVQARAKLFESIEAKFTNPAEKTVAILKLCSGGVFTEGKLSAQARGLVLAYVGCPGFLTSYIAHTAKGSMKVGADEARAELMQLLDKAGITTETGLKSIAA